MGVATTRRVLGAPVRLIGDPVATAAGLGGTELADGVGIERLVFDWESILAEPGAGELSSIGSLVAAGISSLPGGCRLVEAVGVALATGVRAVSFCGSFFGVV